jgi:hypothetical protein
MEPDQGAFSTTAGPGCKISIVRIDRSPPDWIDRLRYHKALTDVCLGKDDSSGFPHWFSASLLPLWGQKD